MRLVVALGGNALLRRGQPLDVVVQRRNVEQAIRALAPVADGNQLIVTHGNGPQIGLLALQNEAYSAVSPYPLDVLGAESEGMIGYLIEEELRSVIPGREVATLLTQVLVDPADPAFASPSKPIGPVYDEPTARQLASRFGWTVGPDGPHWRRLVPSPRPRAIIQITAIRLLVEAGVIVICAGGGGIPVWRDAGGGLHGIEAVIDKDLASALLAIQLDADRLLLLTDVAYVECDWQTPMARPIYQTTPAELRPLVFAPGSMAPKVEAALHYVEATGHSAAIGALTDIAAIIRGEAGTQIRPG